MSGDRGAIWRLLAMGRISPREAERLLVTSREARETGWIVAGCLAVAALAELHGSRLLLDGAQALAGGMKALTHWMGGWR